MKTHTVALTRAASPAPGRRWAALRRTLAAWRFRAATRRALRRLTDRELADIGVDRAAALAEANKPFWKS